MKRSWRRWFQELLAGGAGPKANHRNRAHLMLEGLEDRTLLSSATHFAIVGLPNPIPVGTAVTFTVEALDANNNIDTGYDGTTHLTSTDGKAVLPASAPLTAGVGTFSATLGTSGSQSITVTGPPYDGGANFVNAPGSPISSISALGFVIGGYLSAGNTFDVLEASGYYGNFVVFVGNGNGTFSAGPSQNSGEGGGVGPNIAAIGDFNGDGINDLAFEDNYDYITLCLGNGNGTFGPPATYNTGSSPRGLVVGSFNGSVQHDLAVLNSGDSTITILMANPQGSYGTTFLVPTTVLPIGGGTGQLAVGHFTRDGNLDLAVTNSNANDVEIFLGNGNGTFQAGQTFAAGPSPFGIATADLNNNGIDDIVVNSSAADTVSVLMANGNGTFQSPGSYGAGPSPGVPVIADINGDGVPDIVVNEGSQNEVGILLGNGNGTFRSAPFLASPNNGNDTVIVGDLTGQGLPDIVDGLNVYLNQPLTGTTPVVEAPGPATHFTVSASSTAVVGKPAALTVMAFDQFNDATTDYSGTLNFTSSDPAASFPANATLTNGVGLFSVTFATRGNQMITVSDSVLSSLSGSSSSILVSGPATHFTVQAPASATAGSSLSVTVTAFDSSNNIATGYRGTLVFTSSDNQAVLPANATLTNGVGTFTVTFKTAGGQTLTATDSTASTFTGTSAAISVSAATTTHLSLSFPAGVTAGTAFSLTVTAQDQFNNTATGYTGSVHFLSSDSTAVLPAAATLIGGVGIFTATLTKAGSQTLTATGFPSTTNFVQAPGSPISVGDAAVAVALGDFTDDGKVDIAVSSYYNGQVNILFGNGNGTFTVGPNIGVTSHEVDIVAGDFNGDGKLDLAVATYDFADIAVLLGNGNGTFAPAVTYAVGVNPLALAVADFNHDGKLDLAVANQGSNTVSVLLGNGNGSFQPAVNFAVGSEPSGLAVADFNNDGNWDLATANMGSNTVSVLLGNGNGTFAPATTFAVGAAPYGIAAADFNGDNKQDLVATNTGGGTISVLLGNGNGTFGPAINTTVGNDPFAVAAADFNGDGKTDLFVANQQSNTVSVLLGNGNGTFADVQQLSVNAIPIMVAAGDLTGDGAPDLVVVNDLNSNVTVFLDQTMSATATALVTPAAASRFTVTAQGSATAGGSLPFTVTARDSFNNIATGYTGTVTFTCSDTQAVLPPSSTLTAGVGIFTATLKTAGNQILTVQAFVASSIAGASASIAVNAATAAHLSIIGLASNATAGVAFTLTVTAQDQFNNTVTSFTGTVIFGSSDSQAVLPANSTLTEGVGTFTVTLKSAGNQTLTAEVAGGNQGIGATATVSVSPAGTSHFSVTAPSAAIVGNALSVTVAALDQFNNVIPSYGGTVSFSSSDSAAVLPARGTLVSGVGTFSLTLLTPGSQTLTAADALASTLTGTSAAITVTGAATHFSVSSASTATAGSSMRVTVTALDSLGDTVFAYSGTVHFTSSDTQAALPPAGTLTAGVGIFTLTLKTAGSQILTAADSVSSSIVGTSNAIAVSPGLATHFAFSGIAAIVTAGAPFNFTVTALDAFNNTASGYSDTVHFAATDTRAALPANASLLSGIGVFTAMLKTAGTQTLTISDTVVATLTGVSNSIAVVAASASHFSVSAPATQAAGNPFIFTVTALDPFNNIATGYSGTVVFTSSDPKAALPADTTLSGGVGSFAAALRTAAKATLSATDTLTSTITGSSAITVSAGAASHFGVSAPVTTVSGSPFILTVTAFDPFNNLATSYNGTVHFTSSDSQALLPSGGTLTAGVGTFAVVLVSGGSQTITAIDSVTSSISGTSNVVSVTPNTPVSTHFIISAPNTTTAGKAFVVVVTALDQFNNTATGYTGTVNFSSSDSQAQLPSNVTLSNGTGTFAAILETAGNQTITAADVVTASITGYSNTIAVIAGAATHLAVTVAPLPAYAGVSGAYPTVPGAPLKFASAGSPIAFTVAADDAFGNIAPTYAGTVAFTSSDTAAGVLLPTNSTLSAGTGTFTATLMTPGSQTLTATDTVSGITGTSSAVVTRGLVVTSFTPSASGFTITFNEPFVASAVNMYTTGSLPDDVILATTNSQVSVRGSLVISPGGTSFTFVKTATVSALGAFNPNSGLLAAGTYTVTLRSYSAGSSGFKDALGNPLDGTNSGGIANYQITFFVTAPPVAVGIPDFARGPSNTDAIFLPTTLTNGSTFALSYTNPAASPTTGTASVTFSTTALMLQSNIQNALTSGALAAQIGVGPGGTPNSVVVVTNDVSSGANVLVTFQNALAQATSQLLTSTTPAVSISTATINVANNIPGSGIPIALSSGLNVTSGSFTLQYNPSLLNITGVVSKIAGASFTLTNTITSATSATAVLSLSSPSPISSTTTAITLGSLLANVPLTAATDYGAEQMLHFSSEQLNGTAGPINVTNEDGVEVAAYFGDVTDTGGPFTLQDAVTISRTSGGVPNPIAQTLPGFTAFSNLDPVIIGDVSLQGSVNSTDAGTINQQVAGNPRPTIPYAPIGLPVTPTGPDPTLSVANIVDDRRTTVIVPVNIDTANPGGNAGMVDASLALVYDPDLWEVSAADVNMGSVLLAGSGWQLNAQVNAQSGLIGIEIDSLTPIQSMAGGSLATITMHPRAGAVQADTGLTLVPYVDPSGGTRVYQTQASDAQGAFVMHWSAANGIQAADSPQLAGAGTKMGLSDETGVKLASDTTDTATIAGDILPAEMNRAFEEIAEVAMSGSWQTAASWPDPALLQLSKAWTQPEGFAGDWLAYQGQSTLLGVVEPTTDFLDESGPLVDEQNAGGLVGIKVLGGDIL